MVSSLGIGWQRFLGRPGPGQVRHQPGDGLRYVAPLHPLRREVRGFDPAAFIAADRLPLMNRATQMALAAAALAVGDAGLSREQLSRPRGGRLARHDPGSGAGDRGCGRPARGEPSRATGIFPSNAASHRLLRPSPLHSAAGAPCSWSRRRAPPANYAIGYASDLIRLGRADIMIAGAADGISRIEYTGFNQFSAVAPDRCRPFDQEPQGHDPR